jgi:hypothetical protein
MKRREYSKIWKHLNRINEIVTHAAKKCARWGCNRCPASVDDNCGYNTIYRLMRNLDKYRPVSTPLTGVRQQGELSLFE